MTRHRPRFWYYGSRFAIVRRPERHGKQFEYLANRYDRLFLGLYRVTTFGECSL